MMRLSELFKMIQATEVAAELDDGEHVPMSLVNGHYTTAQFTRDAVCVGIAVRTALSPKWFRLISFELNPRAGMTVDIADCPIDWSEA